MVVGVVVVEGCRIVAMAAVEVEEHLLETLLVRRCCW
jgi:hypothetical protein